LNPRTTLIVVALFALLAGYVYFIELNKTPVQLGAPTQAIQPQVFQLPSGQIDTLEVRDLRSGREIRLRRAGQNGWQFEKPTTREADPLRVEPIITGLAQLQASRIITNATGLDQFGVLAGTLEARMILRDSTPYAIIVGNKTPDGNSYYAIYSGNKEQVFLIATRLVDEFMTWLDAPPYYATPTPTATLAATPTVSATQTVSPTVPLPSIAPTVLPTPAITPKP
jgi:hypothetical protein